MTEARTVTATGPYPTELADLVDRVGAYPGWTFRLEEGTYDDGQITQLRLIITVTHHDLYHPPEPCDRCGSVPAWRRTQFHYPVPVVTYDRASWQRWLRDRVADVHRHEDGEAITFTYADRDGLRYLERPFAPHHGPGRNPNEQVEVGVDPMEQRVLQDGSRATGWWVTRGGLWLHDDFTHDHGDVVVHLLCRPVQPAPLID